MGYYAIHRMISQKPLRLSALGFSVLDYKLLRRHSPLGIDLSSAGWLLARYHLPPCTWVRSISQGRSREWRPPTSSSVPVYSPSLQVSRPELVTWLKNILLSPGYLIVSAKLEECNKNFRKANTGRYGETWSDKIAKVSIGDIDMTTNSWVNFAAGKLKWSKVEGPACLFAGLSPPSSIIIALVHCYIKTSYKIKRNLNIHTDWIDRSCF